MTRQVSGLAMEWARHGDADYVAYAATLIDERINRANARERVICFASAAEFGLSLRHQGERCRVAALDTGCDAIRILYWAAIRRMQNHRTCVSPKAETADVPTNGPLTPMRSRMFHGCVTEGGWAGAALPEPALCKRCEELHADSHCASGHESMRPVSGKYFRRIGGSVLSEAQEHQCRLCETTWTRHRNGANLFATWSIKKNKKSRDTGGI